ncbi:hypothetical protein SAMN05421837_107486 [Amycolatopsis pretoriensis]|uniref:Uncharacterized protein n=1 Tax=Amycolatopsis pretoriensis TaxID=218821 RepID=A0A1H5RAR6_9PSEU|nr:hypothetical protein [Amycolatopsis pretoriensis]SEF34628.1 hypothetical protein SAMN05421837_107486 [Amycolatopsis pretoriensis]
MRYSAKVVGTGAFLLMATACADQDMPTSQPAAGGDSAAPTGSVSTSPTESVLPTSPSANPPGKPRLTVPEGSTPVPPDKVDAAALPKDYPREVWTANGGTILNIRAQEGGCGHALGEATQQAGDRVVVNLSETKAQTGQMCTMDIRYPVISVALAAPLDQRTVVLKTQK